MSKLIKNGRLTILLLTVVSILTGCATSQKIAPVQVGDNQLNKSQIVAELQKLDYAQQQVDSNKGVTGTNVAAALFWLPGLAYTYYDASEATRLIEQRRSHLTSLYNQKMGQDSQRGRRG